MSSAQAHLSPCDAGQLPLAELVTLATTADHRDGAILWVTGDPPRLGSWSLLDCHPLSHLLGLVAPSSWQAIGVRCTGRGYDVADPDPSSGYTFRRTEADAVPITFTFLLDRQGNATAIAASERGQQWHDSPPEGLIGDACRRALGLATPPPPITATELWLNLWLLVVISVVTAPGGHSSRLGWEEVAALHPLAGGTYDPDRHHPVALAELSQVLAQVWSWQQLRRDPEGLLLAEPPPPPEIRSWMDDGMFARWLLPQMPDRAWIERELPRWLPGTVLARIDEVLMYAGVGR